MDNVPEAQQPSYLPTQEQIRLACAEIQKEWTPAERRRRSSQKHVAELRLESMSERPLSRILFPLAGLP